MNSNSMLLAKLQVLNGNQLKILACVLMLIDHIGAILLPEITVLRIIGRLAFPIFAYFIAEGCKYTHNKTKYFLLIAILGIAMMIVQFAFTDELFGNIFITFAMSILLIYLFDELKKEILNQKINVFSQIGWYSIIIIVLVIYAIICSNVSIDYGLAGVMVPVLISLANFYKLKVDMAEIFDNKYFRLILLAFGLIAVSIVYGGIQYWSLLALIPLALYNGERGKWKMKYFFYIFYPTHIALLYGLSLVL